jgi:nicotinamidase/pyrazinamidase
MKALLIVDMQNDFMPGGPLGVPGALEIIPLINALIPHFPHVIVTQDWHPSEHVSFAESHPGKRVGDTVDVEGISQILWPVHCVRETKGADLVSNLQKEKIACHFYKGTDALVDSYSAFFDNARRQSTGLEAYLNTHQIDHLYIAGVCTEYCVLYSTIDAIDLGFSVTVIADACRGIDAQNVKDAFAFMAAKGAKIISSGDLSVPL